jgi:hypothetical protein
MNAVREMIEEMVDEILDSEGPVKIGNLTFDRSYIVLHLDPTAYREMVLEMADSQIEDLQYDMDRLDPETDADEIADIQERIDALENV